MKILFKVFLIFLFASAELSAQVKVVSWNIQDLGKSKDASEIRLMAQMLKDFDIVAIQEVVAGHGGAQAVARLADELSRTGAKWGYAISLPTVSSLYNAERYAYIWKSSEVTLTKKPWLDQNYVHEMEREPYMADFSYKGTVFTLVSFHAVPKSKQPETEIKFFKFYPDLYPNKNLIFMGDYNTPQSHTVFIPLKRMGYKPAFENQKTSLKTKCIDGDCLASEYDNIFYHPKLVQLIDSGVLHFYEEMNLKKARKISDHIPVWIEFLPCELDDSTLIEIKDN